MSRGVHHAGIRSVGTPKIDVAGGNSGDNLSDLTWSFTQTAGIRDPLLLVAAGDFAPAGAIGPTGCTYGGVSMHQLSQAVNNDATSGRSITLYYLRGYELPTIGSTHTVDVSFNDGGNNTPVAVCLSLADVGQGVTFSTPGTNNTAAATSLSATTTGNSAYDLDYTCICVRNSSPTAGGSLTQRGSTQSDSTFTYVAQATQVAGGSADSLSWSWSGSTIAAMISVSIRGMA